MHTHTIEYTWIQNYNDSLDINNIQKNIVRCENNVMYGSI